MKQTAVEWLEDQIKWRTNINDIIIQAKEIEKEQLKQLMWDLTDIDMTTSNKGLIVDNRFDTYWNETFKSE